MRLTQDTQSIYYTLEDGKKHNHVIMLIVRHDLQEDKTME